MTLSFTRVSLGMALGIVGVIIAMAFVIHPILFPPEPAPWCGTYDHVQPIPINLNIVAMIGSSVSLALGFALMKLGFEIEEPEPDANEKTHCPCCGRKRE